MNKILTTLALSILVLAVIPGVFAVSFGLPINPVITTEKFTPLVWMCDNRTVTDDNTEPGRISGGGQNMVERINNYAFEGEKISWKILVMDKNGIDKVRDVYTTAGSTQGPGQPIEADCHLDSLVTSASQITDNCNARIDEANLTQVFQPDTAAYYTCTLTVETADSMYGPYWITVEAKDADQNIGTMAENEYWYFNPVVRLDINGVLDFGGSNGVRPGTTSYSNTLTVVNKADGNSGVMMDMFVSGTDFYDTSNSGTKCPTTNQLSLSAFRYFAVNGAYSTSTDAQVGRSGSQPARNKDSEGYVNIGYATGFNNPSPFYNGFEILQADQVGPYYVANVLAPGAAMSVTFKLNMPEPCNGDFNSGSINFWGEAI